MKANRSNIRTRRNETHVVREGKNPQTVARPFKTSKGNGGGGGGGERYDVVITNTAELRSARWRIVCAITTGRKFFRVRAA